MKRIAIYTRLSKQEATSVSIAQQEQVCREEAARHPDWEVVQVYADEGLSGYQDIARPAFDALYRAIVHEQAYDVLLVRSIDRFSRKGAFNVGPTINAIVDAGCRILPVTEQDCDSDNPNGRLVLVIKLELAYEESKRTSKRIRDGYEHRAKAGKARTRAVRMFGYADGAFTALHPTEAPLVSEMTSKLLNDGASYGELARHLNALGVTTVRGHQWSTAALSTYMHNPTIAGIRRFRGTTKIKATYPAIITEQEHMAICDLNPKVSRKPRSDDFATVLYCCCGAKMVCKGNGTYRCSARLTPAGIERANKAHPGKASLIVSRSAVDAYLWEVFSTKRDQAMMLRVAQQMSDEATYATKATALEAEIAATQQRQRKLTEDFYALGTLTEDSFNHAYKLITDAKSEAETKLARLNASHALATRDIVKALEAPYTPLAEMVFKRVEVLPPGKYGDMSQRLSIEYRFAELS